MKSIKKHSKNVNLILFMTCLILQNFTCNELTNQSKIIFYGNPMITKSDIIITKLDKTLATLDEKNFNYINNGNEPLIKILPDIVSINSLIDTNQVKKDTSIIFFEANILKKGFQGEITGCGDILFPQFINYKKLFYTEERNQKTNQLRWNVNYALVDISGIDIKERTKVEQKLLLTNINYYKNNSAMKFEIIQRLPNEFKNENLIKLIRTNVGK